MELNHSLTEAPTVLNAKNRNKKLLQKLSDIRWSQHDSCLQYPMSSVIDQYEDILTTMVELKSEGDSKCSSKVTSNTRTMESFDFIICLVTWRLIGTFRLRMCRNFKLLQ